MARGGSTRTCPMALMGFVLCTAMGPGGASPGFLSEASANGNGSWNAYLLRAGIVSKPPWSRRSRPRPKHPWRGIARPEAWPPPPRSPENVDVDRLARAVKEICGRLSEDRATQLAGWIHDYAFIFEVDPFLIAALIYRQSRCESRSRKPDRMGIGLTRIVMETHKRQIRDGVYHYFLQNQGEWQEHQLDISRFEFTRSSLLKPEANIFFTAAFLSIYSKQCQFLDATVRSREHRHYVSHFYWGDRVLGSLFEDQVLRDRRRLLGYYGTVHPTPTMVSFRDNALTFPLDGAPRVISGHFGDPRDNGRRHRGVDFYSNIGEPVRAAADGEVLFAGVSHPRRGSTNLRPSQARALRPSGMGRGGLFVILTHTQELKTGYFHLSRYTVSQGDAVKGGQIIGYVGRSGIKETAPHLHFEMRVNDHRIDPAKHLLPYLVPEWRSKPSRRRKKVALVR